MYEGATTADKLTDCESIWIMVGVHQDQLCPPQLFIIVLQSLSNEFKGLYRGLFYDEDLALMTDLLERLEVGKLK